MMITQLAAPSPSCAFSSHCTLDSQPCMLFPAVLVHATPAHLEAARAAIHLAHRPPCGAWRPRVIPCRRCARARCSLCTRQLRRQLARQTLQGTTRSPVRNQ